MPVKQCALCASRKLIRVLDLGLHPLADTFVRSRKEARSLPRYPLIVLRCLSCGHVMNGYRVPPQQRYQAKDYSYDSSNSDVAIAHFAELARDVGTSAKLGPKDLVVDIGGNIGTLLAAFKKKTKARILNIEPAGNIAALAEKNGVPTIRDFFTDDIGEHIATIGGAKVIVSTNAFNHIDQLGDFMKGIMRALKPDGSFAFEVPYLLLLVERLAFDTIYLEHASYFAIRPLRPFLKKYHLTITDIVENDYMGGSIRVTASRRGTETAAVKKYIAREKKAGLYDGTTYTHMMQQVKTFKRTLLAELRRVKRRGGRIIGIGAATKGNTLLNFCGIDDTLLDYVTDVSPLKIGKYTPGSALVIKSDEAISQQITHALILPWNIAGFLKEKLVPKYPKLAFITPHMEE